MDKEILEKANKTNQCIQAIDLFCKNMEKKEYIGAMYHPQAYWPEELKGMVKIILEQYQNKLFNELKNL